MAKKTGDRIKKVGKNNKKPSSRQAGRTLSSGWQLFKQALQRLWLHWPVYGRIILVYGLLDLVFVRGLSRSVNLSGIKGGFLATSANRISALYGAPNAAGGGDAGSLYQSILLVIASLAIMWALRQLSPRANQANQAKPKKAAKVVEPTTKQAYYKSTYALIPFILLLLLISVQFLPMLLGGAIYSMVVSRGLATGGIENVVWFLGFFVLSIWSLYMMSATIIGLFVVTLPNQEPLAAWRAAKNLVVGRRWLVLRKMLFMPVALVIAVSIISLPFAILLPAVAEWVFFGLGIIVLPVATSYIYGLYLELL